MKEFNKIRYNAIHEIVEEILQAIKTKKDVNSCKELLDLLQDENPDHEFLQRISSEKIFIQYYNERQKRDKQKDIEHLVNDLNNQKKRKRVHRLYAGLTSIAAAAILLFGIFIWQFTGNKPDELAHIRQFKQDIQCKRPILVLDNGSKLELQKLDTLLNDNQNGITTITREQIAYNTQKSDIIKYNTLIIPAGYSYRVKLADGSEVMLNAGSRLKYSVSGMTEYREVELDGEAFFKVTKSNHPFIVKTGKSFVKVYGTEFNVNNDPAGDVEVVLVNGSVGFNTDNGQELMLCPNQKCEYNSTDNNVTIKDVDVHSYIAWLNNEFNYDQVPLDYFLKKVATWYGVEFKYDKPRLESIEFYISTSRNTSLSDLLLLIEKSTDLKFTQESDKVFIIK